MISRKTIDTLQAKEQRFRSLPYEYRMDAMKKIFLFTETMGIKNPETKIEADIITNFLINQFGYLNSGEMIFALELHSGGKLEIPKEKQHFGKLTMIFLGAVFSEYENLKRKIRTEQPEEVQQTNLLNPVDEKQKWKYEYIQTLKWINEIKDIPPQANFKDCYLYLRSIGVIAPSQEEFSEHVASVMAEVNNEADQLPTPEKRFLYRKEFAKDSECFKNKCREIYFKRWINQKKNSTDSFDKWIEEQIKTQEQ